jgi:hypothetical protein
MAVSLTICAYIALCGVTHTLKLHHWFLLVVIPVSFIATERGKQFFTDWWPVFGFWFVYDRLRLIQPFLLDRVAVSWPFHLESSLFGWMGGGDVPAHAWRAWLASISGNWTGILISDLAQFIYLSHLFVLPLLLFYYWIGGNKRQSDRTSFIRYVRAFTFLHFVGMLIYVILPAAPPWWISLNGFAQPTNELITQTSMNAAMDGKIVQGMIKSASMWFAAIPSLHGAYPVLLTLLAWRNRNRVMTVVWIVYGILMFATTVILNQHYIIDLFAGALLAVAACWFGCRKQVARE